MPKVYSDKTKAKALAAIDLNGGNVNGAAKKLNIPRSTIRKWQEDLQSKSELAHLRQEVKIDLSDIFENTARQYLERASDPTAIADTKGKDAVMAAAISTDKMRLLRGESTQNVVQIAVADTILDFILKAIGKGMARELAYQMAEVVDLPGVDKTLQAKVVTDIRALVDGKRI